MGQIIMKSNWKEAHYRSLLKAVSWRVWATMTTMIISYFVTGSLKYAFAIGLIEVFSKIILFYLHERIWSSLFRVGIKISHPSIN